MKTLGKLIAVTLIIGTSTIASAKAGQFCIKKFNASLSLTPTPQNNHFAQVQKNNEALYQNLADSGIIGRRHR